MMWCSTGGHDTCARGLPGCILASRKIREEEEEEEEEEEGGSNIL